MPESRSSEAGERLRTRVLTCTAGVGVALLVVGPDAHAMMRGGGADSFDWLLTLCVGLVADAVASVAVYRRLFRVSRGVWFLYVGVAAGAFVALLAGPTATVVARACGVDLTSLGYILAVVGGANPVALVAWRLERGT
jgi:hypothetical protein